MIRGLLGSSTLHLLRQELDVSTVRSREIADRVANASNRAPASFEDSLTEALAEDENDIDLEVEMVLLADEQIRYEAMSQILRETYAQIRASLRSA